MVSTLKLTKIQIPNSDSDVLSFNSITGIMTFHKDIQGEGTATTNLQQGLAKSWIHKNRFGSSIDDSFNISSMADTATGIFTVVFANNHDNIHYALTSAVIPEDNTTVIAVCEINREADVAVSGYKAETAYANSGYNKTDYDYMACVTTHGDLA